MCVEVIVCNISVVFLRHRVCMCKVERLLYRGADQSTLNTQQRSALDVACEFGHSSVSSSSLLTYHFFSFTCKRLYT